jgi:hypothetical protein
VGAAAVGHTHAQYAVLAGLAGGQTLIGGTEVADILKLQGTSGVGTPTSPAIQLLVGNNGATVAATILNNGNILFGANSIFDRASELLGINTITPAKTLDVVGNAQIKGWLNFTDGVANCIFAPVDVDGYFYFVTTTNHGMAFGTNNGWNKMVLSTGGNLGLGTISPGAKLEISGAGGTQANRMRFRRSDSVDASGIIEVVGSDNVVDWSFGVNQLVGVAFEINEAGTTNRFAVVPGGNIGLGTISPLLNGHIVGTDAAESGTDTPNGALMIGPSASAWVMTLGAASSAGHGWIQVRSNAAAVFGPLILNPSGGNVGVGCIPAVSLHDYVNLESTTPQFRLEQDGAGDVAIQFLLTGVQNWVIGIDNSDGDKFKISPTGALDTSGTGITVNLSGSIGIGGSPNANAILDVTSTTKAFMPPRMTTAQKAAIASPTAGMVVFDTDLAMLCQYDGAWVGISKMRELVFCVPGALATGDQAPWLPIHFAGTVVSVYAAVKTASTSGAITIDILKCTDPTAGSPSWTTIFTTKITIDVNERTTETAATPAALNGTQTFAVDDVYRINIDGAGTGAADLTVTMKVGVSS